MDWKAKMVKLNATTIDGKLNELVQKSYYQQILEQWSELTDHFETIVGTNITPERKSRVLKFVRTICKKASPKELEDMLVSFGKYSIIHLMLYLHSNNIIGPFVRNQLMSASGRYLSASSDIIYLLSQFKIWPFTIRIQICTYMYDIPLKEM